MEAISNAMVGDKEGAEAMKLAMAAAESEAVVQDMAVTMGRLWLSLSWCLWQKLWQYLWGDCCRVSTQVVKSILCK